METTPPPPLKPERRIFARELRGVTLILTWLPQRGSFNEPEIVHETTELLELIENSQPTKFVLDLSHCDYLGTVILNAVLKLWKRISHRGGQLVLCNVSPMVTQVLRLTKLNTIWPSYGSRDQALNAIGG
ncbi:MAG: STAS domain-containing protein [Planctomycetia bacterium]|nr:STAS domain-containing protein [Planctomycetia bacterium]